MWWAQLLNTITAILDAGAGGGGGAYESIATATGTGSSGTITFSSIPSTYTSLQIRLNGRSTNASAARTFYTKFNSDSSFIYAIHQLQGNGTAASANAGTSQWLESGAVTAASTASNIMGVSILDLHNYASTTQNKTLRSITGYDTNGAGIIYLGSGLWPSTSAVTSVTLELASGNWTTDTTISLYGIKGA